MKRLLNRRILTAALIILLGLLLFIVSRCVGGGGKLIASVQVGQWPSAVAINPATNMVYVANYHSGSMCVLNGQTNAVTATVPVGSPAKRNPCAPWTSGLAVNPATNTVYVADFDSRRVSVLNAQTNTVTATVPMDFPAGLAVNPVTNMVDVANEEVNTMSVLNGQTNMVTATVRVGLWPTAVAVNSMTNMVYVANAYDDTVSVINGQTNTVMATVPGGSGGFRPSEVTPAGMTVNPTTNMVYVTNSDGSVSVLNGQTNVVSAIVHVGSTPTAVAVNPRSNLVYVISSTRSKNPPIVTGYFMLSVINGRTNAVIDSVKLGHATDNQIWNYMIAVNPTKNTLYVANINHSMVSVLHYRLSLPAGYCSLVASGGGVKLNKSSAISVLYS